MSRLVLTGIGILVLLALVALASRPPVPAPAAPAAAPALSPVSIDAAVGVFVATSVLTLAVLVMALRPARRRKRRDDDEPERYYGPQPMPWVVKLLLLGLPLLLAGGLIAAVVLVGPTFEAPPLPTETPVPAETSPVPVLPTQPPPGAANPLPGAGWAALVVAAALIALGAGVFYWTGRGFGGELRGPRTAVALSEALGDLIEEVRRESDPRRAVIAAYARMERVLGRGGYPRWPWEAPFEYVERALRDLHVNEVAAHRLTELFERARFSEHEIHPTMRDDAIVALRTIRDDLTPPPPPEPAPGEAEPPQPTAAGGVR